MDLSIITVCYNAAAVLPRCIASVAPLLRQHELSVEHLIIDGASTDGSLELLQQAQQRGDISRLISEPDMGIYDAMNKGIAAAMGTICVFINADDEICADAVPACCAPILKGTADYTVSIASVLTPDGQTLRVWHPNFDQMWIGVPYCHQTLYCRTDLLRQMGGFRTDYRIAADTDLIYRLYKQQYRHAVVEKESAIFRTGGASTDKQTFSEQLSLILEYTTNILHKAKESPEFCSLTLHMLFHFISRYFIHYGTMERSQLIQKSLELHRAVAMLLPSSKRNAIRKRYRNKAIFNKILSFLHGRGKTKQRTRSYAYAVLMEYC